MARRPILTVALALLLIVSLPIGGGLASADNSSSSVSTIDSDHALTERSSVDAFNSDGYAEADLGHYDGTITVASSRDDVGISDELLPNNVRNDFLRIQYDEDHERTLRIHIPNDYWNPYSQASVESVTSDHSAEYEPVRGGEYLQVVIHVDEPADIVLPIRKDSAFSYQAVQRVDRQIERATGWTFFSGDEWLHVRGDELTEGTGYELEDVDDLEEAVIQYDAHKDDPSETWLNAPENDEGDGIYVMTRGSGENESVMVVATTEDPPDIRYKPHADFGDREGGYVNDALEIPNRIAEGLGDLWPLSVTPTPLLEVIR